MNKGIKDNIVNSRLSTFITKLARIHMVMGMIKDVVMKSHLLILNEGFFMSLILVASPSSNTLMRNSLILFIVVGLGFWSKSREGVCEIVAFL